MLGRLILLFLPEAVAETFGMGLFRLEDGGRQPGLSGGGRGAGLADSCRMRTSRTGGGGCDGWYCWKKKEIVFSRHMILSLLCILLVTGWIDKDPESSSISWC